MLNWGFNERSQAHAWCVNRVKSHLKRTCTDADKETGLVPSRITDAWGYDKDKKASFFATTQNDEMVNTQKV